MKALWFFLYFLVPTSLIWAQSSEESQTFKSRRFINLTVGIEYDEKVPRFPEGVSFKGTFREFTGATYSKEKDIIRFKPTREGEGTLTVHSTDGKIVAEYLILAKKSKLETVAQEMQSLLGDIEGITIKIVNNKVIVDGQILLPRDMNRIYNVVSQFGDQAASLVTLSPLAQKKIAEFIARDINNPEIEVRAVNDVFILQGVANDEDEKARAEIVAKMYVPSVILDRVEQGQVVRKRRPANDGVINLILVRPR
ncbi:MAG: pilus assembly protein, partial [Bdellovibrio sp.]